MSKAPRDLLQVIAMHGWAGDSRCWKPWIAVTKDLGWRWQCGERSYGEATPFLPAWPRDFSDDALRVVIGHSLGPHLVAPDVLQQADAVILLASFGTFVPPDRAGRRVRAALDGMAANLTNQSDAKEMLQKFLTNVAAPQSVSLLPPGPTEGALNFGQLRDDLEVLRACDGLPRGFPENISVLIVEAGDDRIVDPMAQTMLREALPQARVMRLEGVGHGLLRKGVIGKVVDFVESIR